MGIGDPSLAFGMTWKLGGYWGEDVAISYTHCHFGELYLLIDTSSPHVLLNSAVIPGASEESPNFKASKL
jgi:hypothetical protein